MFSHRSALECLLLDIRVESPEVWSALQQVCRSELLTIKSLFNGPEGLICLVRALVVLSLLIKVAYVEACAHRVAETTHIT